MVEPASIIFFSSLLACVPLGNVYKKVEDVETKRRLGAGIGILITLLICGPYIYHSALMIIGNVITLKYCDKRYVHQASLMFTWMYLLYIFFFVECSKYASWLFQNLALKLVGLTFEIYIFDKGLNTSKPGKAAASMHVDDSITRLSSTDVVTYSYFFLGLHKGPYFTWKVFNDHLQSTRSVRGDFWRVTEQKLKKAFLLSLAYVFMRSKYPVEMYTEDEFYTNYGSDYRYLICLPQLVTYYIEYQIILMLSTSACTEAGFGVYPAKCLAVPGAGPTVPCKLTGEPCDKEEYNFSMLKCFHNEKLLMGPRMKDTVRGWDMSTRYWFSQYIVKNLVNNNFEVRSACSFLFWTIWVGPTIQHIIIALTLWVYIHLESDYAQLYADALAGPWDFGFAIMRMLCLVYLIPCFIIDDKETVLRYYNSIYWMYHIVLGFLALLAIAINKSRIRAQVGQPASEHSRLDKLFRELRSSNLSLNRTVSMDAVTAVDESKTQDAAPPSKSDSTKPDNTKPDITKPENMTDNISDSGPTTSGNVTNTNNDTKQ